MAKIEVQKTKTYTLHLNEAELAFLCDLCEKYWKTYPSSLNEAAKSVARVINEGINA